MDTEDCIDKEEVYDIIRHIKDPEHPNTLEELEVVHTRGITVDEKSKIVRVDFTPTIPGCGMATLIGLMIKVKLHRSLPDNYKCDVFIEKGKHQTEEDINKQLNDKERAFAALENPSLLTMVNNGLHDSERGTQIYLESLKMLE